MGNKNILEEIELNGDSLREKFSERQREIRTLQNIKTTAQIDNIIYNIVREISTGVSNGKCKVEVETVSCVIENEARAQRISGDCVLPVHQNRIPIEIILENSMV